MEEAEALGKAEGTSTLALPSAAHLHSEASKLWPKGYVSYINALKVI